jgi:hypothetical protein
VLCTHQGTESYVAIPRSHCADIIILFNVQPKARGANGRLRLTVKRNVVAGRESHVAILVRAEHTPYRMRSPQRKAL